MELYFLGLLICFAGQSLSLELIDSHQEKVLKFSSSFSFGASTAAFQVEGAWNISGKGPSIWDTLTHAHPELIADHSNADSGPDSYHLYLQDIEALKIVGFQHYRFSISWSRLLPDGISNLNQDAVDYYNELIEELILNDIEPVVTMYHYDLPQYIQNLGGFTNPLIITYFKEYARILFQKFGSRVKMWITFNEPFDLCVEGYGSGIQAPLVNTSGVGEYLCGHHLLLAHAEVFKMYQDEFVHDYRGLVGISLNSRFYYKKDESVMQEVVDRALQYDLEWFLNPIFGENGGEYPTLMRADIDQSSKNEGRPYSRLPQFTESQRKLIKNSADFLGYNYYTSRLVEMNKNANQLFPGWLRDSQILSTVDESWPQAESSWLYSVPKGLGDVLRLIKDKFGNPKVLITENGWSDAGTKDDDGRIQYLNEHLVEVAKAIDDGCQVIGHTVWSIIDNFEWLRGYTEKFGLFSVDENTKARIPKKSVKFMHDIIKSRQVSRA